MYYYLLLVSIGYTKYTLIDKHIQDHILSIKILIIIIINH